MIRLYKLSEINDGLGGLSEARELIFEGRGKVILKEQNLKDSPFAYEDRVYDIILPRSIELERDAVYELEVEE